MDLLHYSRGSPKWGGGRIKEVKVCQEQSLQSNTFLKSSIQDVKCLIMPDSIWIIPKIVANDVDDEKIIIVLCL